MGYGLLIRRINFWFEAHFVKRLIYIFKKKWRGRVVFLAFFNKNWGKSRYSGFAFRLSQKISKKQERYSPSVYARNIELLLLFVIIIIYVSLKNYRAFIACYWCQYTLRGRKLHLIFSTLTNLMAHSPSPGAESYSASQETPHVWLGVGGGVEGRKVFHLSDKIKPLVRTLIQINSAQTRILFLEDQF